MQPRCMKLSTHRHNVALVAVGVCLDAGEHDAQRLLMAEGLVEWVAPILGPARLPVVATQHCTTSTTLSHNCEGFQCLYVYIFCIALL